MKIRKARKRDLKGCLRLQALDKEKYWKLADFQKSIKNKDVIFLVAEEDNSILGYVLGFIVPTKRTEALVHETRVDKTQRGRKIGTKLVNELCKNMFKKGVKEIYAEIESELEKFYVKSCKFRKSAKWIEVKKLKQI
jgi:ribosomal protein S18 acetylase RimI-like enzyme